MKKNIFLCCSTISCLVFFFSPQLKATLASIQDYASSTNAPVTSVRTTSEFQNQGAFTALLDNGQLFSWGVTFVLDPQDFLVSVSSSKAQVEAVYSSPWAFAALFNDGTVSCWGLEGYGGAAPYMGPERQIKVIASNRAGFVALLDNGDLISWGGEYGLSEAVPNAIVAGEKVVSLFTTYNHMAAVLVDPTTGNQRIISWSNTLYGTPLLDTAVDVPEGKTVTSIVGTDGAFTALLSDNTIQSWGEPDKGGTAPEVLVSGKKVKALTAGMSAFAAVCVDGSLYSWGAPDNGGVSPSLPKGATAISVTANDADFAAVLSTGDILSWGFNTRQSSKSNQATIKMPSHYKWMTEYKYTVSAIIGNGGAFTALLLNPDSPASGYTIQCWGESNGGGVTPPNNHLYVSAVVPAYKSFTAIYKNGTIFSWGSWASSFPCGVEPVATAPIETPTLPVDAKKVPCKVVSIVSNCSTYIATLSDGSLFQWGGMKDHGFTTGNSVPLPAGTKALWIASPFIEYRLKQESSTTTAPQTVAGSLTRLR